MRRVGQLKKFPCIILFIDSWFLRHKYLFKTFDARPCPLQPPDKDSPDGESKGWGCYVFKTATMMMKLAMMMMMTCFRSSLPLTKSLSLLWASLKIVCSIISFKIKTSLQDHNCFYWNQLITREQSELFVWPTLILPSLWPTPPLVP